MATKDLPTAARLHELLRYEPETGKLFWKVRAEAEFSAPQYAASWNTRHAGKEAGTRAGYVKVCIDGCIFMAHRIVWAMEKGVWPALELDHEDQNPRNNRVGNLREVAHIINLMNESMRRDNASGCTGVTQKTPGKWRANIQAGKQWRYLGTFDTFEAAMLARKQAEKKFGFSPNHGRARA